MVPFVPDFYVVLRGNMLSTDPIIMDGDGVTNPLLSNQSLLLFSSLAKTGSCSFPHIADKTKTPQSVLIIHNEKHLNKGSSPPYNTKTLPPTAFTSPSHRTPALHNWPTFPYFVPALVEKQSSVYTNNNKITANNSQPPIFSDAKPNREFNDDDSETDYDDATFWNN